MNGYNYALMGVTQLTRAGLAISVAGVIAFSGCGSDSSGDTTANANADAQTSISIPSPTSPIPTTTTQPTTTQGKKKPAQTTTSSGGSASCSVPDAFQDLKYTGLDCTAAVGVATAWDQNGKDCNTIDNPNSPEGYNRTCTVEGFTCKAKRDTSSDNRFVTCTQGGQSVRFTWLPA